MEFPFTTFKVSMQSFLQVDISINGESVGTYTAPNDNSPSSESQATASDDFTDAQVAGNSSYRWVQCYQFFYGYDVESVIDTNSNTILDLLSL